MTDKLREALRVIVNCGLETRHGLMDSIDNNGRAYQSQQLADLIKAARAALAAAPQPTPDREALVEAIGALPTIKGGHRLGETPAEYVSRADVLALLARGLRLPGGEETMAWAVVEEDGKIAVWSVKEDYEDAAEYEASGRVVPVAIRVVEGGDNAA